MPRRLKKKSFSPLPIYGCMAISLGAWASAFMKGGALGEAGYQPLEVVGHYQAVDRSLQPGHAPLKSITLCPYL